MQFDAIQDCLSGIGYSRATQIVPLWLPGEEGGESLQMHSNKIFLHYLQQFGVRQAGYSRALAAPAFGSATSARATSPVEAGVRRYAMHTCCRLDSAVAKSGVRGTFSHDSDEGTFGASGVSGKCMASGSPVCNHNRCQSFPASTRDKAAKTRPVVSGPFNDLCAAARRSAARRILGEN